MVTLSEKPNNNLSGGSNALLGINTKFPSTSTPIQPQEIDEHNFALIERYYLQALARELLRIDEIPLDYDGSYKLKDHRVCMCGRYPSYGRDSVDLVYSPQRKRGGFIGLSHCSSVWVCPVCASGITEERRKELNTAFDNWSGGVVLVTMTIRHNAGDDLAKSLAVLSSAYDRFLSGRYGEEKREFYKIVGAVKALEVTWGRNGWHPHLHVLFFGSFNGLKPVQRPDGETDNAFAMSDLEATFKRRWQFVAAAVGGSATYENGLTVKDDEHFVREYIAKYGHEPMKDSWSLQHEVSKANIKKGRQLDHYTPFQLLSRYGDGDKWAGELFKMFVKVFHGKKQIIWSRGLKARLGVGEKSDEQIVEGEMSDASVLLGSLSSQQWTRLRKAELIPALHLVLNSGNVFEVKKFLLDNFIISRGE